MADLLSTYTTQNQMSSFFTDDMGIYNVKAYDAVGDGSTDDYTALYNTSAAADDNGGIIFFPTGTYKIGTSIIFPSNVTLWFADGAKLSPDSGKTVTINGPIEAPLSQVFAGNGTITLFGSLTAVYPQWWGASGDGDTTTTGSISAGSKSLVVASATTWKIGHGILVTGAGAAGANLVTSVTNITGLTFTIADAAGTTVAGAVVQHDDIVALQSSVTITSIAQTKLFIPSGAYLISSPILIPVDDSNYVRLCIQGAFANSISSRLNMPGTVIKTASDITAIKTPTLSAPNNSIPYWAKYLEISDIYVQGVHSVGHSYTASRGLDLGGVQFLRAHNVHVEGFGTGLYLENGSEIYVTGLTLLQNNYYGAYVKRSNDTDMQVWFDNLATVHNYIGVVFNNPRMVWVKSGETVTTGALSPLVCSKIYIENCNNSQIHFENYCIENDEDIAAVSIDAAGVAILSFNNCNFESNVSSLLVDTVGYFDLISISNSMMDRVALASGLQSAIVSIHDLPITDGGAGRACKVELRNNSPMWADFAVKNNMPNRCPLFDYVPEGWVQINQCSNMDEADANRIIIYGDYNYTSSNVLSGKGRLYWNSSTDAYVLVYPPKALTGINQVLVTLIVDDNIGTKIPTVNAIAGIGTSPVDWLHVYTAELGSWIVGARTFKKYGYGIIIKNKTTSNSPGINFIQLGNFYGDGAATGLETLNIYVRSNESGKILTNTRKRSTAPSTGLDGYNIVGDIVYNSSSTLGNAIGWMCTVAGKPGTFGVIGQNGYRSGAVSPVGAVVPYFIREEYLDSTAKVWYKSTGLTNADWVALN